jgi:Fur family ferric uptake transcriptional regulator/Fur family zinc uptake transcriptional regulator
VTTSRVRPQPPPRARALLKGAGLRCTPVRNAVLRALSRRGRPLAHTELARARGLEALDRVTLYRTLTALQETGLVHRVQDQDGVWRFCAHVRDESGCPGNHPHFHCTRCGRMRCLTGQELPWVAVEKDERVTGKQLVVYGLCAACARRAPAREG